MRKSRPLGVSFIVGLCEKCPGLALTGIFAPLDTRFQVNIGMTALFQALLGGLVPPHLST